MSESKTNIYQRLLEVQKKLIAPRAIDGKFGKARSAEQILAEAKPVCQDNGLYLFTSDHLQQIGERNYITTTATVVNVDNPDERVEATASAWENEVERNKFGQPILDTSQVSGKTSSYSKKYALQNLFAIDDTKDADFDHDDSSHAQTTPSTPTAPKPASDELPEESAGPKCPVCGGAMWDNRDTKTNPKAPDFKCKDKTCDGVIWPPKDIDHGDPNHVPYQTTREAVNDMDAELNSLFAEGR
jgi:hypothetical protein